ncbi:helix-turn-helix domain-containing protein [Virgibacillus salexigens]|uniref:helix-turn-helix domain-containing protein n=1 Tax=Virgibacillus salexigens TaxID=61016 RepID=UPI00190975CC|nr:helix-turn-helix transcriptional regulator [Virgibacillus salexigens]
MEPGLLKYLRNISNLSQHELAVKAGLSRSYVSLVELGERKLNHDTETKLKKVFADEGLHDKEIQLIKDIRQATKLNKNRKGVL